MAINWKKLKKQAIGLWRKPKIRWAILGGSVALVAAIIAVVVLFGGEESKPLITDGDTSSITLVLGGDLNVTDNTVASGGSEYDYTTPFLDVAQIFAQADASLLNFEGNFCGQPYGSATRSAPQAMAETLAAMGVDFLQMANSCSIKNGMDGLSQTLNAIRNASMEPLGAYASNSEFAQQQGFTLRSICGIKVAFVAFTKGMDGMGLPTGSENCVNLLYTDYTSTYKKINTDGITNILQAVEKAQPDITIALVHWGSEENTSISSSQKKIADLMLENGVDAIIGTHSHQLQSINYDEENGTVVAYSLGDFYGDGTTSGNQYSLLLQLEITKNWDTGAAQITALDHIPIYTLTESREQEPMRIVQIKPALEAYENNHISKVSETAYKNMKAALEQIEKKIAPLEDQ